MFNEDYSPTRESTANRNIHPRAAVINSAPTFIYKRHAALALVKDTSQLHRNILNELDRFELSDYSFGIVNPEAGIDFPLTTLPSELIKTYQDEGFCHEDQTIGYLLANSLPAFRTTIEKYIESAPMETSLIRKNRELISLWRNYGFMESYLVPVDEDGTTFIVSNKYEDPLTVQGKVEKCTDELCALGKVIRHVCLKKFPEVLSKGHSDSEPLSVNKRPLEVLEALANGCPTVYAVAAELGISINTANHHIATAKASLKASSLPHAVAIALREGLLP